jgi:hypothetical protein
LTFRGLYSAVFRRGSNVIHSTQVAVDRHVRVTPSQIVVFDGERAPPSAPDIPALAIPLSAFMLLAYHHHFDWPDPDRVRAISDAIFYE